MKTLKEQIAVMQHYARDGEVETTHKRFDGWRLCRHPKWDWDECDYRIFEPSEQEPKRPREVWINYYPSRVSVHHNQVAARKTAIDGCVDSAVHFREAMPNDESLRVELAGLRAKCSNLIVASKNALDCVDAVFQSTDDRDAILPDFCKLGDDKFRAVVRLAEEYLKVCEEASRYYAAAQDNSVRLEKLAKVELEITTLKKELYDIVAGVKDN